MLPVLPTCYQSEPWGSAGSESEAGCGGFVFVSSSCFRNEKSQRLGVEVYSSLLRGVFGTNRVRLGVTFPDWYMSENLHTHLIG